MSERSESSSTDAHTASVLGELIEQCLDRIESDGERALDELCGEHPEHAERLRRHVVRLRRLGLVEPPGESATPSAFPERLGDFRLLRCLGGGGMGVVYLAEQISLGRQVALKLVRPEQMFFPGARARFRREAEAVARLHHPGIVPIHTVGEEHGIPFFAMERIEGCTLADALRVLTTSGRAPATLSGADLEHAIARASGDAAPAPTASVGARAAHEPAALFRGAWVEVSLRIVREVALALEHAHGRGVLHRDVKPSNVMLTRAGRVLLLDFGLATSDGADRLTRTGAQLGSLPYMAPEQVRGDWESVDRRTDVYQLGVALYEMLALRLPFDAETQTSLRAAILDARARPLRACNPRVSLDVETVCATALDRDPARRYDTAADLARDLANVLQRRPIRARRASTWLHARRWVERRPALASACVLAFALVVGGPLVYAWQQKRAGDRIAAQNVEIERANARLVAALEALGLEKRRAEDHLQAALGVTDKMLVEVGDKRLEHVPNVESLRTELLGEGLALYRRILAGSGEGGALRREMARIHVKVGDIEARLGRPVEATRAYEAARALFEELARDDASASVAASGAALCDFRQALLAGSTGRFPESAELCERARLRLEPLVAAEPEVVEHRERLALTLLDGAHALSEIGRVEEAFESYRGGLEHAARLVRDHPGESRFEAFRAVGLANLARLFVRTEAPGLAEPAAVEAERVLGARFAADPADDDARDLYASALTSLSMSLVARGRPHAAEVHLRRALEVGEPLVAVHPRRPDYRVNHAHALGLLADIELADGRLALARESRCRAIELLEILAAELPGDRILARALANHYTVFGVALSRSAQWAEAEEMSRRSIALLERLAAEEPGVPTWSTGLAAAQHNLGNLLMRLGRLDEAGACLRRAVVFQQRAIAASPSLPAPREFLRNHFWSLAEVEARRGEHAAVAEIAHEFTSIYPASSQEHRRAGEFVARCVPLARADEELSDEEREALAASYADRAMALLEHAVRLGDRDREYFRTDPDLACLRERDEFRRLIAGIEAEH